MSTEPKKEMEKKCRFFPLPELSMFVVDADLTEEEAARYVTGLDFTDRKPSSASRHFGGITGTHRFAILSNQMDGEEEYFGAVCFPAFQRYKVLDVFENDGCTQILMLHVPSSWSLLKSFELNGAEGLIRECRETFRRCAELAVTSADINAKKFGEGSYPMPYDFV